jgi:dTMP kinase
MSYFITFEGADGCGKTTQLNLISKFLNENGIENITTREPGATELGLKLREILLHHNGVVADECETFLYLADRAQHVQTKIKPALEDGKIVLCDRHTDSTLAYQGYGRGISLERIKYLNDIATSGFKPHLTIVFDVDSAVAQKRVGKEKDRLESEGLEFHNKVRMGYLKIAQEEPKRVRVVDANKSIEEVYEQTKRIVVELLKI